MSITKITILVLLCCIGKANAADSDLTTDTDSLEFVKEHSKRMRNAPSTMEVITKETINKYGAITLDEVLEKVIGIHLSRASDGNASERIVRGINSRWIVLVNGMEIDRILSDAKSILLDDVERIELVKGSHFSIYGEDAIAGTINLVSHSPGPDEAIVKIDAGTQNTIKASARLGGGNGRFGYTFYVAGFTEQGSERIIEADRQSEFDQLLGTNVSLAPNQGYFDREIKNASLILDFGDNITWRNIYYERDAGLGTGLAQALGQGRQKLTRYTSDLRYRHQINGGDIEARIGYNSIYAEFSDAEIFPDGSFGGLFPDGAIQDVGQFNNEVSVETILTKRFEKQTIRLGIGANIVDVSNDYDNRNYFIEPGNPIPQPLGSIQDALAEPLFREYSEDLMHLSIRDEISIISGWKLNAGLRVDNSSIYGSVVNPRASIEYTPDLYTAYKLLYGEATRTPNNLEISSNGLFIALGDEDLEPSKIQMIEGVVERKITSRVDTKINVFAYEYKDILSTRESTNSPNGLEFFNTAEVQKGNGAEIRFDWKFNDSVDIVFGWAYQSNSGADTSSVKSPKHQPFAEANIQLIKGWNVNINTTGVIDRERLDRDTRENIDDYQIVNLAITNGTFFNNSARFSFVVNNIFDADAREDISTSIPDDLPVEDRAVRLGISWEF